jgi:hypothetical protein
LELRFCANTVHYTHPSGCTEMTFGAQKLTFGAQK